MFVHRFHPAAESSQSVPDIPSLPWHRIRGHLPQGSKNDPPSSWWSKGRGGTANRFMVCTPLWELTSCGGHRPSDHAGLRGFARGYDRWPLSEQDIGRVMGNLNEHKLSSLYHTFPLKTARRLSQRFEVHYTPKHGSWLNITGNEISALGRQCLTRRIPHRETLTREAPAWPEAYNADPRPARWRFKTDEARPHQAVLALHTITIMFNHWAGRQNQKSLQLWAATRWKSWHAVSASKVSQPALNSQPES